MDGTDPYVIGTLVAAEVQSPVLSSVLNADRERAQARSRRLTEARPSVPTLLFALLIASAATGIFVLAAFTLPDLGRRVQIGVLAVLGTLLALFIGLIFDMDRPYRGLVAGEATDMTRVAGDLTEDWAEDHSGVALPCDDRGEMVR